MIETKVIELLKRVKPLENDGASIVGASEETINSFELLHSFVLPGEVKEWFRRCDGANVNPGGLDSLFQKNGSIVCLDWHFHQYPEWKSKGWIPLASDGCGDIYILTTKIVIPSTGTHPVFFLDQDNLDTPNYAVASGLWKFLFFLFENEILTQEKKRTYWPFDKKKVIAADPYLIECKNIPLPWEV